MNSEDLEKVDYRLKKRYSRAKVKFVKQSSLTSRTSFCKFWWLKSQKNNICIGQFIEINLILQGYHAYPMNSIHTWVSLESHNWLFETSFVFVLNIP